MIFQDYVKALSRISERRGSDSPLHLHANCMCSGRAARSSTTLTNLEWATRDNLFQ